MKMCYAQLNVDKCLDLFFSKRKRLRVDLGNGKFLSLNDLELYLFQIQPVLGPGITFENYYIGLGTAFTQEMFEKIFIIKEVWEI